jgi:hypothetical protein
MTVQELINELAKHPRNAKVFEVQRAIEITEITSHIHPKTQEPIVLLDALDCSPEHLEELWGALEQRIKQS